MSRNLKVLGLALAAVFAMSAVAASSASAFTQFMTENGKTASITADQEEGNQHVFTVDSATVKCTTAHFATVGEEPATSEMVTVHPTYSGCTAFGFANATVNTSNCDYTMYASGRVDITATEPPCSIIVTGGTCEVTVGVQSEKGTVTYENLAGGKMRIIANVAVTVNKLKDGFLCPLSGTGAGTGTYKGNTIAEGKHEGAAEGITAE